VLLLVAAAVLALVSRSQLAAVAAFYDELMVRERRSRDETERERWVRSGEALLAAKALGEQSVEQLAEQFLRVVAEYVGAEAGALFLREPDGWLRKAAFGVDPKG